MDKPRFIKKINSHSDWFPKSYAGYLLGIDMQAMGLSKGAKDIPFAQKYGLVYQNFSKKEHWDCFWDCREMVLRRKQIIKKAQGDSLFGPAFFKTWKKHYQNYVRQFENITSGHPEKWNDKKSYDEFKKLYELALSQAAYGYAVDCFLTSGEEDWLVALIKKELKDKATPEAITQLTATVFSSFVNDYEISLLELALLITAKKSRQAARKAVEIEKDFFWIKTNYLDFKRQTKTGILKEARALGRNRNQLTRNIQIRKTQAAEHRAIKNKLIKQHSLSPRLQNVIHISELFSEIQDRRKECVLRNNTLFYELAQRTAKKLRINKKLILYAIHGELFDLLLGKKVDWKSVQNRVNHGVLLLYFNGTYTVLPGLEAKKIIKTSHLFPNLNAIVELKGSPAFAGSVTGTVRVLRNTKEIAAFPKGCILVANQTTPEFVPAMKKAAAILTDQGGITSHAAIVSRELRIPCIVGIKNATRLLKDGDKVEVDANTGMVKKV